jgi:predicted acetyltransferase
MVDIVPIPESEKAILRRRMQDYIRELMPYDGGPMPADGVFDYPYFDDYWREPEHRWPFWGMVAGKRAAFALVHRQPERFEMAEFYSFPEFRRTGVALPFAQAIIGRFPGPWELTQFAANAGAVAFWRRVLADYVFEESTYVGAQSGKERLRQIFTVR